ncbi:MAG: AAA family ATPase, partial [Candidatus Competibacteraceae bacterium]|nr:AAA family ATPase [Candidatus Competibacteraceae bacterium]
KDENNRYAILIDEINRSNISKIFGELITLIELDKREKADQATCATLTYSGTSFSVPANVDIIGSMNTADRSIALVDTALRRRFDFIPMFPNTDYGGPLDELTVKVGDTIIDIQELLKTINLRVERLYDRDHTIGYAYFLSLKNKDDDKDLKDDDKDLKVVTVNQSDGQKLQKSNQCSNPRFDELKRIFSKRILPLLGRKFLR